MAKRLLQFLFPTLCAVIFCVMPVVSAAQTSPGSRANTELLPYSFSNFVWWRDSDLRSLLKNRIPGLGDEIAPGSAMKGEIRGALVALLKEKGIAAEVQSVEPSSFGLTAKRAPGAPSPAIVYSVLSPRILIDKVIISHAPEEVATPLSEGLQRLEGKEYSSLGNWLVRSNVEKDLQAKGYMDGRVEIAHGTPRRVGDHYLVDLLVTVTPGAQYRIGSISADGGPLLRGRDLSSYFAVKPGDIAGADPFGRLAGELRAVYWHYGYADVEIHSPPMLDRSHATVSYHLEVVPGPLYHLHSLTIQGLDSQQEKEVRKVLEMKPGDIFDEMAINRLYHQLSGDPLLAGETFTFSPREDKAAAEIDLTLDFGKLGGKSSVKIQ